MQITLNTDNDNNDDDVLNVCCEADTKWLVSYRDKLYGAFYARAAGCTLGAPVEGWTSTRMENYAAQLGVTFPLTDYWPDTPTPNVIRYLEESMPNYLKGNITRVPCDDDIGYVLLSLFIVEESPRKRDFTTEDVANSWLKYITVCFTAEEVALRNLKRGISWDKAAEVDNSFDEWIGADIRCDGYAYINPGDPKTAADMAERDALISHRDNGVYGSRYFAAVIADAFTSSNIKQSLFRGLDFIPQTCELSEGLRWALDLWDSVDNYKNAMQLVDKRYPDMAFVHTINNACLTVFALALGGEDISKIIANAVAMAHDCDCTAATAGSIAGATYGLKKLDPKWYTSFNNKVGSYFNGEKEYFISDILTRFEKIANLNPNPQQKNKNQTTENI
ncbi:MAG: ADP-ribosylglycohydrolase family protein [Candidatus Bathyarchaeota archaeon]|nr:ADP-ribosylglycohydrolase family protein [Candidatus Termiticorpusculum sp.]